MVGYVRNIGHIVHGVMPMLFLNPLSDQRYTTEYVSDWPKFNIVCVDKKLCETSFRVMV